MFKTKSLEKKKLLLELLATAELPLYPYLTSGLILYSRMPDTSAELDTSAFLSTIACFRYLGFPFRHYFGVWGGGKKRDALKKIASIRHLSLT